MNDLIKIAATAFWGGASRLRSSSGYPNDRAMRRCRSSGKPKNLPGLVWPIDRGDAGADAQLPGGELHIGSRLADVEEHLEFFTRVGMQDSHAERGACQMPGPIAAFGEPLSGWLYR